MDRTTINCIEDYVNIGLPREMAAMLLIEVRITSYNVCYTKLLRFLDEISELPLHLQSKLLGVIQDREFYRVGGRKVVSVITSYSIHYTKLYEKKAVRMMPMALM